jgi:hypothetical protein
MKPLPVFIGYLIVVVAGCLLIILTGLLHR